MLKLPTHSQKPSRAPHAVLDGDIQWEDDDGDDHPSGGDGKRPLTTCQAILASVVGSSHVSLGGDDQLPPDEKCGTRNMHNQLTSVEDHTPATHTGNATLAEHEVDEEESGDVVPTVNLDFETFSRCASRGQDIPLVLHAHIVATRPHQRAPEGDEDARMMALE
ncbi:hypothetical protein BC827DRAFT_1157755 [Russula dissimulans]|nr:hypothetical protein BC827DRAFT_1157755 [Russula dissimulans]